MRFSVDKPVKGRGKPVIRICLKCERPFVAVGRFNRLCHRCAKRNGQFFQPAIAYYGPPSS